MAKSRVPLPAYLVPAAMFEATCCVCCERGRAAQTHHIDEDQSHNMLEPLTLEESAATMQRYWTRRIR